MVVALLYIFINTYIFIIIISSMLLYYLKQKGMKMNIVGWILMTLLCISTWLPHGYHMLCVSALDLGIWEVNFHPLKGAQTHYITHNNFDTLAYLKMRQQQSFQFLWKENTT